MRKGTGWSYLDGKASRCRTCGKYTHSKPLDSCPQEHKTMYSTARMRVRRYITKLRIKVLSFFGGKCACCGYSDALKQVHGIWFLQLDHVNGRAGMREWKPSGYHAYKEALKNPEGFRLLCKGCNASMEYGQTKCELHKNGVC